jgi:hypothetical protein
MKSIYELKNLKFYYLLTIELRFLIENSNNYYKNVKMNN